MDDRRFDALTRSLAAPTSRRGFLGGLAALAAGLAGGRAAAAPGKGNGNGNGKPGRCGEPGHPCKFNRQCCESFGSVCLDGACTCPGGQAPDPVLGCVAPTTTTTTAAPTTTTTTTSPPLQGTCASGQDFCQTGEPLGCNGDGSCRCGTSLGGATVCRGGAICTACAGDADCKQFGQEQICFTGGGACSDLCTTYCAEPCPSQAA